MGWGDPTHTRQLNLRGPLELHTKGKEGPLQTKTQAVEVHLSGPALQRLVAVPRPAWPGAALPGVEPKGMMATANGAPARGHNSAYFGVAAGDESGRPGRLRVRHPGRIITVMCAHKAAGRGFGGRVCRARARHARGVSFSPPFPLRPPRPGASTP